MKKIGIIIAIAIALVFTGCASSGGSSGGGGGGDAAVLPPYVVDLSGVQVKNTVPFNKNYDDLMIALPALPDSITEYRRLTLTAKAFDGDGNEIPSGWGNAMVTVLYDASMYDGPAGNIPAIRQDGNKNHVIKEFNIDNDGKASDLSKVKGMRVRLSAVPTAVLLQCSNTNVKYLELTNVIFHNDVAWAQ
uniref:Lipoprotein n=1 Tax=uncultured bacterium contig00059 TaxID=1181542 RepID=A0A0A6ZH35_9BACT|nr:hypothetical protein [uncultured bacterium contig00059]